MPSRWLTSEAGTVSTDWVLLTALMLGTAFAVVNTVSDGAGGAAREEVASLRGLVIQSGFGSPHCPNGAAGLQAREDARVAAGGANRVDVGHWLDLARYRSDSEIAAEHADSAARAAAIATRDWTHAHTLRDAAACALVQRGLTP